MQNGLVTQNDAARMWGYDDAHDQIRQFLRDNARTAMEVQIGKRVVKLYERAGILRLGELYARRRSEIAERNKEQARKMGLQRQQTIRASGLAGKSFAGTAAANMLYDLRSRVEALEKQLASLQNDLGVQKS